MFGLEWTGVEKKTSIGVGQTTADELSIKKRCGVAAPD
jgi:hypothetical protein